MINSPHLSPILPFTLSLSGETPSEILPFVNGQFTTNLNKHDNDHKPINLQLRYGVEFVLNAVR